MVYFFFFFQAEDGIRDLVRSRGLGDVYKRQGWGGGGWNLLGNPYTSALNVSAFIDENYSETAADNQFDPNYVALYLYNGSTYSYIGYSTGWDVDNPTELSQTHIQAGQGFFVLANNNNSSFTFRRSTMQGHANVTLHKSAKAKDPWPGLELKVNCNGKKSSAMIVYNDQMTVGLDPGYDVGLYDSGADIDVFTTLAACLLYTSPSPRDRPRSRMPSSA